MIEKMNGKVTTGEVHSGSLCHLLSLAVPPALDPNFLAHWVYFSRLCCRQVIHIRVSSLHCWIINFRTKQSKNSPVSEIFKLLFFCVSFVFLFSLFYRSWSWIYTLFRSTWGYPMFGLRIFVISFSFVFCFVLFVIVSIWILSLLMDLYFCWFLGFLNHFCPKNRCLFWISNDIAYSTS
jgi:hypothetical protein